MFLSFFSVLLDFFLRSSLRFRLLSFFSSLSPSAWFSGSSEWLPLAVVSGSSWLVSVLLLDPFCKSKMKDHANLQIKA
jgi:hypothetical protein